MPESDLELLIRTARAAGDIATRFTGPDAKRWDKDDNAGPVTEADLAVNEYLHGELLAARPGYGWLSEETEDDSDRLDAEFVFIVDPIDGTRSFIEGGRTWAHSIAIAHRGQITAGAVFLPMRDMLYSAELGEGSQLNGQPLKASASSDLARSEILSAKPNLQERFWQGGVPGFHKAYRPSLAYRMALVGEGRFDGMITFRPTWDWDIAAGSLIASEAGARVSDRRNMPLQFNTADPRCHGVIAAAPILHSELTKRHEPEG